MIERRREKSRKKEDSRIRGKEARGIKTQPQEDEFDKFKKVFAKEDEEMDKMQKIIKQKKLLQETNSANMANKSKPHAYISTMKPMTSATNKPTISVLPVQKMNQKDLASKKAELLIKLKEKKQKLLMRQSRDEDSEDIEGDDGPAYDSNGKNYDDFEGELGGSRTDFDVTDFLENNPILKKLSALGGADKIQDKKQQVDKTRQIKSLKSSK